jgi:hypothetical protein
VAIAANQVRLSTQEVGRKILRGLLGPSHVVPGRNDFRSTHSLRKIFEKLGFINISFFIQKLTRQNNGCAENSLSGRDVVFLAWGSRTQRRCAVYMGPARRACRASLRRWWKRFTRLLECGW